MFHTTQARGAYMRMRLRQPIVTRAYNRGWNSWGDGRILRFWGNIWVDMVFRKFWWIWWSVRGVLSWNSIEIILKYGLEVVFWICEDAIVCATTFLLVNYLLWRIIQNGFDDALSICAIESIWSIRTWFQSFQKIENKNVGFQIVLLFVYWTKFWR